jgi:hypothetical protein
LLCEGQSRRVGSKSSHLFTAWQPEQAQPQLLSALPLKAAQARLINKNAARPTITAIIKYSMNMVSSDPLCATNTDIRPHQARSFF